MAWIALRLSVNNVLQWSLSSWWHLHQKSSNRYKLLRYFPHDCLHLMAWHTKLFFRRSQRTTKFTNKIPFHYFDFALAIAG